jgi:diphthamide biosynthesis methyltransferase
VLTLCCRQAVESEAEEIYASAAHEDVAFLVVGDPFCATTHTDLMMRAHELGIKVQLVQLSLHVVLALHEISGHCASRSMYTTVVV